MVSVNASPLTVINSSSRVTDARFKFPVFSTVMVKAIVSPRPVCPSPSSVIVDVFVISIPGVLTIGVSVLSSSVFSSKSSSSSLKSNITWSAGEEAVAET